MAEKLKEVIISKEDAVFWMDNRGRWHNAHGLFQNKKVIDYFHTCIRRDENGFYLTQVRDEIIEKVYFPYEETALFVFNVRRESNGLVLVLNTGEEKALDPADLCVREDVLGLIRDGTLILFTDRTMMKIADLIEEREGCYYFTWDDREWPVKVLDV
jgi:hypothetical protein